jgi:hypothetical protein
VGLCTSSKLGTPSIGPLSHSPLLRREKHSPSLTALTVTGTAITAVTEGSAVSLASTKGYAERDGESEGNARRGECPCFALTLALEGVLFISPS